VCPANRRGAARSGEICVADIPVHEFEPCTGSAANVRVRVTQSQALPVECGEPFVPGHVLESRGAVTGNVDSQNSGAVGGRRVRHPCRCAVVGLDPAADLVMVCGDVAVCTLYGHRISFWVAVSRSWVFLLG